MSSGSSSTLPSGSSSILPRTFRSPIVDRSKSVDLPAGGCIVQVTFGSISPTLLVPWHPLQFAMSLDGDLRSLASGVKEACDYAMSGQQKHLQELHKAGWDVACSARIITSSRLDLYANGPVLKGHRVESVKDLLTSTEIRHGQCVVYVHVTLRSIDKPSQAGIGLTMPSYQARTRKTTYPLLEQHRSSNTATTHSPMEQAIIHHHLGDCPNDHSCDEIYTVAVREINGLCIGSLEHEREFTIIDAMAVTQSGTNNDDRLPELPPLTFNTYPLASSTGVAQLLKRTGQRIELAIRIVDRISSTPGASFLADRIVPGNVILAVKHCSGQKKLIGATLQTGLRKFGEGGKNPHAFTRAIFRDDFTPQWEMDLWVLPQAAQPKKLFRFEGGLANFMDRGMVESGNGKMYMEAHIVPKHD